MQAILEIGEALASASASVDDKKERKFLFQIEVWNAGNGEGLVKLKTNIY